ncbi:hypothetical protein AB5J56_33540 [Streptomyces sp. R21]|uniref:Uncharacterized protein n=1 Tax=Streptomyces sp. R21 TaxID=3238627 RepID=A0AB39PGQ9_9ACTN
MIDPEGIPHFTGDLGLLDQHVSKLRLGADGIRRAGEAAHTRFQALAGVYQAPEATDLFASTAPARDRADEFAGKVETVAAALAEYAATVKPIIDRLKELKVKAAAFVASVDKDTYRGSGDWTHGPVDNDWTKNQDKIDEHTALMNAVDKAKAAFEAAEIAAHDKITALVGGTQYMQQSNHMLVPLGVKFYGATAETYEQAQKLPWGTPQALTHSGWDLGHQIKEHVWDGFVVDGVGGTIDGLYTMVGVHGSDQAKLAWEGLTRAVVGGETYLHESSGQKPTGFWASDFAQGSKPYAKETGKAFLKWDMWKTNPARASGSVVTFNLLPFAGAAASARVAAAGGKAGAGAKALLTAARVADAVDPISTAVRTTRYALPKISEVTANIRTGLGELRAAKGPESVLELSDGSTLRVGDGTFTASKNGVAHTNPIPHELSASERASSIAARPQEPRLVGARAHTPEASAHSGEGAPQQASHDIPRTHHSDGDAAGNRPTDHSGRPEPGHAAEGSGATHRPEAHGGGDGAPGDSSAHGAGSSHGSGDGSDGGSSATAGGPSQEGEPQPMLRGGETEQRIRDAVKGIPGAKRPKPNVMERVLDRLASESDGQRVADIIGSGHFNQGDEYGQVVSALGAKREQMFQPAADQLIFADDLVRSGVPAHAIDFEQKFPIGADMDIRIKDESGDVYAYQMKHLNDPQDPVSEITRGKYLLQLANAEADHSVLLVDGGRGTIAEWMSNGSYDELMAINGGTRGRKGMDITFVIRLEDGNLVIPPGSKTDPKDML